MTTVPEDGAAPAAAGGGDDVQIHKLLSRGFGDQAQALLVLVSTSAPPVAGEDVWVAIDREQPVVLQERSGEWRSLGAGRALTAAEFEALDLDRGDGAAPFDLTIDPGRTLWLARFEFADHPHTGERWHWVLAGKDVEPPRAFKVLAWRSRLVVAVDAEGLQKSASFEPLPGGQALASVTLAEVVMQPLFELGVLLVHGIGNHGIRETLVHWAEPIVEFWRRRASAISHATQDEISDIERLQVNRWIESHALRSRAAVDDLRRELTRLVTPARRRRSEAEKEVLVPPAVARPRPFCVTARAEHTVFPELEPGQPSATLLRLSSVDGNAALRESHVLFAEAAWSREAFPPTPSELYRWLTDAIPVAVWSRLHRLMWTRPREIVGFAALARAAKSRLEWFRVGVSSAIWLLQMLVLPAVYIALALAGQIAIALIGAVGLLPIPWLQRGARWIIGALMGTLGQSYALQTSAIRRSAIVSSVTVTLNWLSDRCQRIAVLSHSQGAEITRLAFLDARPERIERWYTVGAGIAPLSMLTPESLDKWQAKLVIAVAKAALAASVLLLIGLALDAIPGVDLGVREAATRVVHDISWQAALTTYGFFLAFLVINGTSGPAVTPTMRPSLMTKWHDYYASEDPVPGGSLIDRFAAEMRQLGIPIPQQKRIFNSRFAILDHTSYFRNIEEFVAPIALDLLRLAGMGGEPTLEGRALQGASRRRDWRTWWSMLFSVLALSASAATFFWVAFGPPARGADWLDRGRQIWQKTPDLWDRLAAAWSSGLFGAILVDLRLSLASLAVLAIGWSLSHWLGRCSQDRLIRDLGKAG